MKTSMSWDTVIMTFGESQYFDGGLSKFRDHDNTASIISVVNVCYFSPFSCFFRLQSLTERLLPARSELNDVTAHLVRDDNSAAQVVFS